MDSLFFHYMILFFIIFNGYNIFPRFSLFDSFFFNVFPLFSVDSLFLIIFNGFITFPTIFNGFTILSLFDSLFFHYFCTIFSGELIFF